MSGAAVEALPAPAVVSEWQIHYTMVERIVALARIHARRNLTVMGWGGDVDDAVVVVSELVTNAIKHAYRPLSLLTMRLAVLEDGALLVDVGDPVPAHEGFARAEQALPPDTEADGGRGLHLVLQVADSLEWFVNEDGGKTVRARIGG